MSFAVCRMQKMKSFDLKGIQFHNQRERDSKTNPDIDKEKSKENYDFINDENIDYNEQVKEIIESQKTGTRKTRKDAVLVNELLVTSDREFFEQLDPDEQKRFFEESFKLFSERYGEQNIAYATVHNDEKTPHLHIGVVPMRDGRLQGKNVFNRAELIWIQDKFPEHMKKLGFDLERGEKGSNREHIETQIFKKQTLENDIDFLEESLKEKKNELLEMSEGVPAELKIRGKKEKRIVIEDKLVHFGKPKTTQEETGNIVITPREYKKNNAIVNAAVKIKADYERLQTTDLVRENKDLTVAVDDNYEAMQFAQQRAHNLLIENKELLSENRDLKSTVADLKHEIGSIYQSAKDFIEEHTRDLQSFKHAFKNLVDKVRKRTPESEFERSYKRENTFSMESVQEMNKTLGKSSKQRQRGRDRGHGMDER